MATGDGLEAEGSSHAEYWDHVVASWQQTPAHRLWRAHSDAVNIRLLRRWLPSGSRWLLKTDLFDEAVGEGLYPELARRAEHVTGIDVSPQTVERAQAGHPGLDARVGDVLALPFETGSFDTVVSNSTLDHFEQRETLVASMAELARVTRSGGRLIITLDNRSNPIVALRTSRQLARLHRWLRVVPYFVGVTLGPRALRRHLTDVGFEVGAVTAIMHWPPQLSANRVVRRGQVPPQDAYLAEVLSREFLERWPTRYLTGHFVAACAVRR